MKLLTVAGCLAAAVAAHAQGFAPPNLANVVLNATISGASGGTVTELLTSTGIDYSLGATGGLTDPVNYTYATTGANTATITESLLGTTGTVAIAMTFTSATAGSFVATYSAGGSTQNGTFSVTTIPDAAPLANMASRTTLAAGQVAISGIVVGGNTPRRVLIRAVGPGLVPFGITSALTNPNMTLVKGQTVVATNDDWGSTAALQTAFSAAGAFSLPANSRDSAAVLTLDPGAYTTVIRGGSSSDAGEVLIEVYYLN